MEPSTYLIFRQTLELFVFYTLVYLFLLWFVKRVISKTFTNGLSIDRIFTLSKWVIFMLVLVNLVYSLSIVWSAKDTLVSTIEIFSVGIGMGILILMYNLFSSIGLYFQRPYKNFEIVKIENNAGTIQKIGNFFTEFKTFDGVCTLIASSKLFDFSVTSIKEEPIRRMNLEIFVPRSVNLPELFTNIHKIIKDTESFLNDPPVEILFSSASDGEYKITIFAWFEQTQNWIKARSNIQKSISEYLKKNDLGPRFILNLRVDSKESLLLSSVI